MLLKKGHSGLCSEHAYLLEVLAESAGIRTRHVGLNGHVVMEAWYDDDWHMFDPDLEVVPMLEDGKILSVERLSQEPELVREFYTDRGASDNVMHIVNIVTSREDNSFQLHWMVVKHLAYRIEKVALYLKWLLPSCLLIVGYGLVFRRKRFNAAAG
ncbi:MAG: hypothetical protein IBX56_06430 [Methylomicrobium sp.]|nr:hypothetical protein [Methylomicrobium sp.]